MLILGKYELLEGESYGGKAKVLAGRDTGDGKKVAIKIINGTGEQSEKAIAQDLYELELRILKKLKGVENVIQLVDFGYDSYLDENVIVLDWMAVSLAERLEQIQGVIPEAVWVKFSQSLMVAIAKAHGRSIAHRDIKPSNIMFRTNSTSDWDCVLIDFGISKFVGIDTVDPNLTMREYRTPAYASVNYLREEDYSRDVFGLAAVMIRLRGTQNFDNYFTVHEAITQLSNNPNINRRFTPVLAKGVEPDAKLRYKTIKELNAALAGERDRDARNGRIKIFSLVLSQEAREQLRQLQSETVSRNYADLKSLLAEQVYLRLPRDSDPRLTSDRFNLQVGFLDLKCKGPSEDSRMPHSIYVRDIKEIEQSEMEFKVARSKSIALNKFRLVLDSDLRDYSSNQFAGYQDYAALVSNLNQPAELKLDEKISAKVSKWETILDAKEEFILGNGVKTKFELVDSQFRSLTLRPIGVGDALYAVPSSWGLEGSPGQQLVLDFQHEDGTLAFTASKDVTNFPRTGVVYPTLGDDAPSFRRQKQALQSIRENGDDLGNWVRVVVEPNLARVNENADELEYFDEMLDTAKRAALDIALQAEDVALVQGPPGTGKTSFIVELIRQFSGKGSGSNKILLVSKTHIAVDNALDRLFKSGHESLLRVGRDEKVSPETKHLLIENRLGDWRTKVESSSSEALNAIVQDLGCNPKSLTALSCLERLREIKLSESLKLEAERLDDITTFTQQVDHAFEDAGIQILGKGSVDFDTLDQDYKDSVFNLQDLGYDRNELITWGDSEITAEMQILLSSQANMERAWSLTQLQSKWIRLFKADERLKKTYVSRTQVIAGTCIGFLGDQYAREMEFDLCIIDEASQATATEILVPMSRSRKTVLVGDTKQLPPTEEQMTRDPNLMAKYELSVEDVEVTLFETLANELPQASQIMLTRQYRMLPVIGEMISHVFYQGKVESEPRDIPDWVSETWGEPLKFVDTSLMDSNNHEHVGKSVRNSLEARIAADLVAQLLSKLSFTAMDASKLRIVILVPYTAQVTAVKHVLTRNRIGVKHVEVLTFDSAQGIECDFAIVLPTRSENDSSARRIASSRFGFISRANWKRINVGLSRARFGLAIVGNRSFLRDGSAFQDVIEYLEKSGAEITNGKLAQVGTQHD
jgi:hypothetical protein